MRPRRFSLHDLRRTLITVLGEARISEKEVGVMVGVTPKVARRQYDRLNQRDIARRNVERLQSGAVLVPWRKQREDVEPALERQTATG